MGSPAISEEAKEDEVAGEDDDSDVFDSAAPKDIFAVLDPDKRKDYDNAISSFADLLQCWGMLLQRRAVLKYASSVIEEFDFASDIEQEQRPNSRVRCAVCNVLVRGMVMCCPSCGHGGHAKHVKAWFKGGERCAYPGCECRCVESQRVVY